MRGDKSYRIENTGVKDFSRSLSRLTGGSRNDKKRGFRSDTIYTIY